jgi:phosphoribosylformimino-5-aminoimidazole carboxamide ribotide isomerase
VDVTRPFEILPAIDLRGGRVVRLRQGDFARETAYSDDPTAMAVAFADAGARWLHVVDLDAARTGQPVNDGTVAAIVGAAGDRVRVEVAGGLRDATAVARALSSGASRAVVGTAALRDPAFAAELVRVHGAGRIVVAIDVRDGQAVGQGWAAEAPGVDLDRALDHLVAGGVTMFEVTAIDRDGLLAGPDLALYERLSATMAGTAASIIASGGIATIDDLRAVREIGCAGAIVGRAVYEGRITIREALDA